MTESQPEGVEKGEKRRRRESQIYVGKNRGFFSFFFLYSFRRAVRYCAMEQICYLSFVTCSFTSPVASDTVASGFPLHLIT